MGWRGNLRTVIAISRQMEREAIRRQRALQRQQVAEAKMAELELAQDTVERYENLIERLTSVHKAHSSRVSWLDIVKSPAPDKPLYSAILRSAAQTKWESYRPSIWSRLFGNAEKQKAELFNQIAIAEGQDKQKYEDLLKQYAADQLEWQEEVKLATEVLEGRQEAYMKALKELNPFSEISDLGTEIKFRALAPNNLRAEIYVHGDEIFPKQNYSLLKSGKLSSKEMPKAQLYALHQDYVCGCVLRVASELCALLPIEATLITAKEKLLNPSTGLIEVLPIVSAYIPRKTLSNLNLDMVDPSDAMKNFIHKMEFKKNSGFAAVEEVDPPAKNHNSEIQR